MKKVLLLLFAGLFLIQFSSFGQSKLNKKPAPTQEAAVCDQFKPQVKKAKGNFIVTLKNNAVDDWVLIPEAEGANPLTSKRNRVLTSDAGKYTMAVKVNNEICLSEVTLSNTASRSFGTHGVIWLKRTPGLCNPWWRCIRAPQSIRGRN